MLKQMLTKFRKEPVSSKREARRALLKKAQEKEVDRCIEELDAHRKKYGPVAQR